MRRDSVQIKRLGNGTKYLRVWENWVFTTPPQNHYNNFQPYTEMQTLMYYDCWHHKWEVSRVIYYAQNGSMVKDISLTINESSSATWEEIIPDTVGEDNLTQICRTYRQQLR
ncbi:surface-adhesin E family protein [Faucicola mancuniensis]|uniref:surface-adhesin E family protein n=1 Tax=Faucicola mancuniensis TaxID=1309795 RepID=UPI0039777394